MNIFLFNKSLRLYDNTTLIEQILNEEDIEKYKKRLLKHGLVMKELKKLKKALREAKGRESMNTRMVEALEKEVITVIQTKKSIAQERFIRFMSK